MKKKIAVICAHLPERNTGMLTVDLAAHTILRENFPNSEITLFSFKRSSEVPYEDQEKSHEYLDISSSADQFFSSDIFLYWGDFIHSHSYWEYDMDIWNHELQSLPEDQKKAALMKQHQERSKFIFLSELPDSKLKNVVVYGSTIITNEAKDFSDELYTNDFNNFFSKIGNVFFRDALSAAKISPLRMKTPTLGSDCAFLLRDSDLNALSGFTLATERSGIGVFLGRSPSKLKMLIFAKMMARHLNEKLSWLPWFISSSKMRFAAKFFGLNVPQKDMLPGEILSLMSGYKFIVTDTYHVCVNAWRMGIPAVCIGQAAGGALNSLADKKKEILFEQYGARRLYVFLEKLMSYPSLKSEVHRISEELKDEQYTQGISNTIQEHRSMALDRLVTALRELHESDEQYNKSFSIVK